MAILELESFEKLEEWARLIPNLISRYALYTNLKAGSSIDEGQQTYFVMLRKTVSTDLDTAIINVPGSPENVEKLNGSGLFTSFRDAGRFFPLKSLVLREGN